MIIDFITKTIAMFLIKGEELLGDFFWLLLVIGICMLIPGNSASATTVNGELQNTEIVEIVECEHCNCELVSLD